MATPLLSIVIPVWNAGDGIRRIVSAIVTQSFDDFELILVDDGSTDDTLSVLRAIERTDKRIKVYAKPNGGPSSARNVGLEKSTGTYIQFYDSDDGIADDALTVTTSAIERSNSDLLVSGWQIDLQSPKGLVKNYKHITPQEKLITDNIPEYVLRSLGTDGTLYNLWNKLFRADIIRSHNLRFREDLRFGEDVLFSLEYFKHVRSLGIISDVTYHYQTNSKTSVFSSSSIIPEYREENDKAIVAFVGDNSPEVEYNLLQWLRWRWLMSYWSLVAGSNKKLGEKFQLIKAFQPEKLVLAHPKYIGLKKYFLQLIAMATRTTTIGSLLLGWTMNLSKKTIILLKTARNQP